MDVVLTCFSIGFIFPSGQQGPPPWDVSCSHAHLGPSSGELPPRSVFQGAVTFPLSLSLSTPSQCSFSSLLLLLCLPQFPSCFPLFPIFSLPLSSPPPSLLSYSTASGSCSHSLPLPSFLLLGLLLWHLPISPNVMGWSAKRGHVQPLQKRYLRG